MITESPLARRESPQPARCSVREGPPLDPGESPQRPGRAKGARKATQYTRWPRFLAAVTLGGEATALLDRLPPEQAGAPLRLDGAIEVHYALWPRLHLMYRAGARLTTPRGCIIVREIDPDELPVCPNLDARRWGDVALLDALDFAANGGRHGATWWCPLTRDERAALTRRAMIAAADPA